MALYHILAGLNAAHGFRREEDKATEKIGLELDALISEAPEYTATATKNKVERGSDVSDHVALNPLSLNVEGVVTNSPTSLVKILSGTTFTKPAETAYKFLKALYEAALPFEFVGGLEVYKDMVIVSLSAPRKVGTANALLFTCKMEQIKVAETKEITLAKLPKNDKAMQAKAAPKADMGYQPIVEAKGNDLTAHASGRNLTDIINSSVASQPRRLF